MASFRVTIVLCLNFTSPVTKDNTELLRRAIFLLAHTGLPFLTTLQGIWATIHRTAWLHNQADSSSYTLQHWTWAACFSETSVSAYRTTRCHNPENIKMHIPIFTSKKELMCGKLSTFSNSLPISCVPTFAPRWSTCRSSKTEDCDQASSAQTL
jgi:hypothetical protein